MIDIEKVKKEIEYISGLDNGWGQDIMCMNEERFELINSALAELDRLQKRDTVLPFDGSTCPVCGAYNDIDVHHVFCYHCGQRLKESEATK